MKRPVRIGVIGAATCPPDVYQTAYEIGRFIAEHKALLITGGLGGVMEGASKGTYENGGITVGILPTRDVSCSNPYVMIPIPTGLGHARNVIVVQSSDLIIAVTGGMGTLSEIAIALKLEIPVIGYKTWAVDPKIRRANSLEIIEHLMNEELKDI